MAGDPTQSAGVPQGSLGVNAVTVADANYRWSRDLLVTLVRDGVRHAVISSGSRCTPLVLAASRTEGLRVWTHPDERAAGFIALGIGKASRAPAVLICTSGTAAANYFPAVIEARLSRTPLIVLTADRPPALRRRGAPQTIDQIDLYGRYPLHFCDLPVPDVDDAERAQWIDAAARAAHVAVGYPHGPVHLNLPFREPLTPGPDRLDALDGDSVASSTPSTDSQAQSCPEPDAGVWDRLAGMVESAKRGLIICGPQNSSEDLGASIHTLAAASGFPVLADVASQVRFGEHIDAHIVSHYDLFLKGSQLASELAPDLVIRFGGLPTSKTLNLWLQSLSAQNHVLIDDHEEFADPYDCATWAITSPLRPAADEVGQRLGGKSGRASAFASAWHTADSEAAQVLKLHRREPIELFAGDVVAAVFEHAPARLPVYLSNSMAIRFGDAYAAASRTPVRVLYNRGANGIDGVVSSAAGAAAALGERVVIVTGDVALLHDFNALLAVRQYNLDLKIILLNDDGGGIFSLLPIADHAEVFEPLVAMPHGRDFDDAARFHGIAYSRIIAVKDFVDEYCACLNRPGPEILEVRYDRLQSARTSREIFRRFRGTDAGGLG